MLISIGVGGVGEFVGGFRGTAFPLDGAQKGNCPYVFPGIGSMTPLPPPKIFDRPHHNHHGTPGGPSGLSPLRSTLLIGSPKPYPYAFIPPSTPIGSGLRNVPSWGSK